MNIEKAGAVISRGAGVLLLVTAFKWVLSWWTTFHPATFGSLDRDLHDTYFFHLAHNPGLWVPPAAQGIAALILILFSRSIGRWLAGGLSDEEPRSGSEEF